MKNSEFFLKNRKNISLSKLIFIIAFTAFSVAINFLCGKLVYVFSIPIYLDSVATISVVAVCGLFPGIACAILSNFFLYYKKSIIFSICHILTALGAYFVFKHPKSFQDDDESDLKNLNCNSSLSFELFLWAGFFSAITNTIAGNLISTLLFKMEDYSSFQFVAKSIYVSIPNIAFSNWITGFVENTADKILSALISFAFYKIFKKFYKNH